MSEQAAAATLQLDLSAVMVNIVMMVFFHTQNQK
jgi:hypothetical protein